MEFVFATKNPAKMREIREILEGSGISVLSMEEAGVDIEIIEDGETFEENAVIKAKAVMEACGKPALADDSGLAIDFLDGGPGVYSARYLGEDTPYAIKNGKILDMLKNVPDNERSAQFVCVIAAAFPDGRTMTERGEIKGVIAHEIAGENGFGYDPIFFVPEYGMTTAQMTNEQKHAISHRGIALRKMRDGFKEL